MTLFMRQVAGRSQLQVEDEGMGRVKNRREKEKKSLKWGV
jgi:hypothetical protein